MLPGLNLLPGENLYSGANCAHEQRLSLFYNYLAGSLINAATYKCADSPEGYRAFLPLFVCFLLLFLLCFFFVYLFDSCFMSTYNGYGHVRTDTVDLTRLFLGKPTKHNRY